jgi:hypothetical protein
MKSRLAIILLASVVCLQLAVIARLEFRVASQPGVPWAPAETAPATAQQSGSGGPSSQHQPEPFRWAQLESSDYRTYVRNLRSIQCPEQTIRDIIMADVDCNVYAARREKLKSQEQELAANPFSAAGREELRRKGQDLLNEELSVVDDLLGVKRNTPAAGVAGEPTRSSAPQQPPMPLAFAAISNIPGLNEYQEATVRRLQGSFLMELGQLDPNSPEYAEKWQQAQPRLDAALKAALGNGAYQKFQLEAARQQPASQRTAN